MSEAIADRLGLPLRTLQRRLSAQGSNLKRIVEDVRRTRSRNLLRTDMTVRDVAILLGYSTTACFIRDFKRWFDSTPGAFRNQSATHD